MVTRRLVHSAIFEAPKEVTVIEVTPSSWALSGRSLMPRPTRTEL
jgi:hypothetical protein